MAHSGDAAQPDPALPESTQSDPAQSESASSAAPAAEVLGRVIDEQRRAEAALHVRFLEHGMVDQAIGVLMARLECSPKEAFEQLLEIERRSRRDLLEVAGDLVGQQVSAHTRVPMDEAVPVYGRPAPARTERAADGDELARLLLADTLAWSGAVEAAIALLQPDGALELIGAAGLPLRVVSQWRRIPPLMNCLLNTVLRDQGATWIDAVGENAGELPALGAVGPGGPSPNPVRVAVPLRLGRGLIGAIEVGWPAGTAFSAEVRREIAGLVEAAAPAVVRARRLSAPGLDGPPPATDPDTTELDRLRELIDASWEPALLVSPIPDQRGPVDGLRVAALNGAARELLTDGYAAPDPVGRRLSEALPWAAASGAFEAFRSVLMTGTPFRDPAHSYVEPGEAGGRARTVSVGAARVGEALLYVTLHPADDDPRGERHAASARLRRMAETGSWEWDAASGTVTWSTEALIAFGSRAAPGPIPQDRPPYAVHPDDQLEHDRLMRTLSSDGRPAQGEFRVVRPDGAVRHLRFAGEPVLGGGGTVASVFGTVQDVSERRRAQTALELAHIQLAAQRSRAESERQLANLLQQVIMPVEPIRLPSSAGLQIAARYRPAGPGAGVGGDWYGLFPLPDERLLLTVGDIAGHGFGAATAMAQLFHALHGLALTGAGSGQLLRWLNAVTCSLPAFTIASACVALYDPADRGLRVANAGHPSPVLVRGGTAATLPRPDGPMLGVHPDSGFEEETVMLEPADVLLLYTDGLIERRRHSAEENTAWLLAEAAGPEPDLDAYVDRILERGQSDTDDDTCILAVRFS